MKQKKNTIKLALLTFGILAMSIMAFQFGPSYDLNYEPVLMSRADMEASVQIGEARPIVTPGKMWIYNDLIFLIEQYKGVHIIDNINPAASKTIGFIQVDGCTDMTVKGNIMYVNNAVDMIGIKGGAEFGSIEVVARHRNMLPTISSPEPWADSYFYNKLPENTIIVRWVPYQ